MKVNKYKNYIKDTFLKLTERTWPFGTEDELVNMMKIANILPKELQKDSHGNYFLKIGESKTVFASHLDTVSREVVSVNHVFDGKMIRTDGKTILGADDKAGVTILLYLIKNNIPGLYYFFVGEEVGCIGSGLASKFGDFKNYDRIISFDRKDLTSVITHQSGIRTCSDEFAKSLSNQLNRFGLNYKIDTTGVYTDSAEFTDVISECTNLSVGYYREHTVSESQDIHHLESLAEACLGVDWENLPKKRDASKKEWLEYDYGYDKKSYKTNEYDWSSNYSKKTYSTYDDFYDEPEDWPGQRRNGNSKKTRRNKKRGKIYYDNGGTSLLFNDDKKNNHYDSLIDKMLDNKLSKEDLEVIKNQYLNMENDNDMTFYNYLLENS